MVRDTSASLERHEYESVAQLRGSMNIARRVDPRPYRFTKGSNLRKVEVSPTKDTLAVGEHIMRDLAAGSS